MIECQEFYPTNIISSTQKLYIGNKTLYEKSFYEFVKAAWPIIDSDDFIPNWHIDCICAHMEALNKREITILDVNIPPGFAKSILCSVLYPAWVWTTNSSRRFLTGSHNMDLAIRDTLKCRRLIESPWYQERWGNVFQLTTDQNTKSNYENNQHGYRVAFSSTGGTTGLRGDDILLDDALSQSQSESKVEREGVNDFLCNTLFNRQNITTQTAIMGIGQRFHPQDYHSVLLSLPGCFHIDLQMEFVPEEAFSSRYFKDPRIERGEVIWKIPKFNEQGLALIKQVLGKMQYSAQYQQRPIVQEGSYLKRSDWGYYDPKDLPANLKIVSGWDFAAKTGNQNDYTVCIVIGKCGNKFYVIDLYRKKVEYPQAKRDFINHMENVRPKMAYIEDASNGTPLLSDLSETKYFSSIKAVGTKGRDKLSRVIPITPIVEAGNVLLPKNAPWLDIFIEECANFPNGDHDDICFAAGTKISTLWGNKNIEDVKCGDTVITPFGLRKVLKVECTGIKKVINYKNTIVTSNHPFFTYENGFVRVDALNMAMNNDIISIGGLILWKYKKLLYSMEQNIDLWGREGIILASRQQMKAENILKDYMLQFGSFIIKRKFLKSMKFITKMVIILITTLIIWNVYILGNIVNYISLKTKKNSYNILKILESKQQNGMEQRKGSNGIGSMRKIFSGILKSKNIFVNFVRNVSRVNVKQTALKKGFVLQPVTKNGVIDLNIKSYKENAVYVQNCLKREFLGKTRGELHVEGFAQESLIGRIERQKVYNLTVDRDGVYYANKFLVSNCDALAIIINNERRTIGNVVAYV